MVSATQCRVASCQRFSKSTARTSQARAKSLSTRAIRTRQHTGGPSMSFRRNPTSQRSSTTLMFLATPALLGHQEVCGWLVRIKSTSTGTQKEAQEPRGTRSNARTDAHTCTHTGWSMLDCGALDAAPRLEPRGPAREKHARIIAFEKELAAQEKLFPEDWRDST